jgi:hypothetical protein
MPDLGPLRGVVCKSNGVHRTEEIHPGTLLEDSAAALLAKTYDINTLNQLLERYE